MSMLLERTPPRATPEVPEEAVPGAALPPKSRPTAPRWARWTAGFLMWTVMGAGGGIALSVIVPSLFRHQVFTVMSGSMSPAIRTGDVVIDARVSPGDVRIGDIVTFRDPEDSARLITHRVRSIRIKGDQVLFVTKGDSSNAVQHWAVAASGTLGRVAYRIPHLGYLLALDRGRLGRLVFLVIPAVLLGAWKIVDIWKPEPREVGDEPLPVA